MSSSSPPRRPPKQQQHPPTIQPLALQPQNAPGAAGPSALVGTSAVAAPVPSPLATSKKRKTMEPISMSAAGPSSAIEFDEPPTSAQDISVKAEGAEAPAPKKSRTNTPWTPAEEKRLKTMRDDGKTWSEIAKTFPNRTEGSVKKHWYKDMHYADFAEDESAALLQAIKDYDASKWKVIGQKVGKPAKACEQYAKENFAGRL